MKKNKIVFIIAFLMLVFLWHEYYYLVHAPLNEKMFSGLVAEKENKPSLCFYYNEGFEHRIQDLKPIISEMYYFYQDKLNIPLEVFVVILDEKDWVIKSNSTFIIKYFFGAPYGLPNINKNNVAFMPATDKGIVTDGTMSIEKFASDSTLKIILQSGFSYKDAAFKSVDLIGLHELGHAFARQYGINGNTPAFMGEMIASFFAYAFLKEKHPDLAQLFLATFAFIYDDYFNTEKQKYKTLQELEEKYASDPNTYSWYEGQLLKKGAEIYATQGLNFLSLLKEKFPTSQGKISVQEALNLLEQIAPNSKEWAKQVFGDDFK